MELPRSDDVGGRVVSRSTSISPPSFRAALGTARRPRTVWDAPGEATVVAEGVAAELTAAGPERFERVRAAAERLLDGADVTATEAAARPRLFGGFSFHEGDDDGLWEGFPEARFVLPRVQVTRTDTEAWLTVNAVGSEVDASVVERRLKAATARFGSLPETESPAALPGVESRQRRPSRSTWRDGVREAIGQIEAGELRKVVLAQALRIRLTDRLSVPDLLARLGDSYPDCYRFLIEPTSGNDSDPSFLGATPEQLVRVDGTTVETGALAGTTGRGETAAEDEWLQAELQGSEKNAHEHELVVEAIREQLTPLASSVVADERRVRSLEAVQHLWTPITATLLREEHVLRLVEALHPTPAVGGLPPDVALETIRATEPFDRGWYAAPVGWFDAAGNGSFAVALRSALVHERTATLFAGVGIVADSDPDREWDEVQLKYRPILDELGRREPGQ